MRSERLTTSTPRPLPLSGALCLGLSRHPGLSAPQVAALPPDRQYKYQIERAELELTVNKAMQKKFDLIMAAAQLQPAVMGSVTPDRLLRNSKLLHPTNCVSLYSRHRTEHSLSR